MKNIIVQYLKNGQSIILVGPADSGKSHFAVNELMPALKEGGVNIQYLNDCDADIMDADIYIVDEVETLFDKEFLEELHPEENPYYEPSYLKKVARWNEKLSSLGKPALFILTRNSEAEIENLVQNMSQTDWGVPLMVIPFK